MKASDFLKKKQNKSVINLNDLKFDTPVLFHASAIEHAASNLQLGHIKARTIQRYWEDGRTYKDDHPNYKSSGWMYGWSMTRERNYAGIFAGVVFVFDRNKVQSQYKVKPLSWSYRVANGSGYYKKEREDYVIGGKDPRTDTCVKEQYAAHLDKLDALYDSGDYENSENEYKDWIDFWHQSFKDKRLDLSDKNIKGVLISDSTLDIYGKDNSDIKYLLNHKLFLGVFDDDNARLNYEKQTNPQKNNRPSL